MTKILKCSCQSEQQDRIHGKGNRVHNECGGGEKKKSGSEYRCTVCCNVKGK